MPRFVPNPADGDGSDDDDASLKRKLKLNRARSAPDSVTPPLITRYPQLMTAATEFIAAVTQFEWFSHEATNAALRLVWALCSTRMIHTADTCYRQMRARAFCIAV